MKTLKVLLVQGENPDRLLEKDLSDNNYALVGKTRDSINFQLSAGENSPDIVIFDIRTPTPQILKKIREINQLNSMPVIIFAVDNDTNTINKVIKSGASAYIVDGLVTGRIKTIIEIALARFQEQQKLKNELKKTKTQLEQRKLIDRAKGILIQSRNINEDEAYHMLRKLAMERSLPIGEMAKNVISMAELLK